MSYPSIGKKLSVITQAKSATVLPHREYVMKHRQVGVSMGIEVLGLRNFADMASIRKKITTYVESILPRINTEDLSGWRLLLLTGYRCTDFIGVYKKFLRHPSDKEYEISISIPIPYNTQAPYGIPTDKNGRTSFFSSRRKQILPSLGS